MDNIIDFPGGAESPKKPTTTPPAQGRISPEGSGQLGIPGLTEDQEKAIQLIGSGQAFVLVAISPTDTGADFFTAIDGEADDLRNAGPHLPGVIDRLYSRRGLD